MFMVTDGVAERDSKRILRGAHSDTAIKDSLNNLIGLLKVKANDLQKGGLAILIGVALLYLSNILQSIVRILLEHSRRHDGFSSLFANEMIDYSVPVFFGVLIGYVIVAIQYKKTNKKSSIYPQTNATRFLSTQIINYATVLYVHLAVLTMYFLSCGAIKLFSVFVDNVYLGLNFSVAFIAAGFLTHLAYSFLAISVFEFVGAIFRKWLYGATAFFTVLATFALVNIEFFWDFGSGALGFLTKELSFGYFVLKTLAIWLIIVALSFVINRRTVYYKSHGFGEKKKIIVACTALASLVVSIGPAIVVYRMKGFAYFYEIQQPVYDYIGIDTEEMYKEFLASLVEVRIDASHLPKGGEIDVMPIYPEQGVRVYDARYLSFYYPSEEERSQWENPLENLQGDTIVLKFSSLFDNSHGINIGKFVKQDFNAYLDGSTLYIGTSGEKSFVAIVPVWGFARQFDCYRDRGHTFGSWTETVAWEARGFGDSVYVYVAVE